MKKLHLSAWALGGLLLMGTVFTACKKDKFDESNNPDVSGLMAFNLAPEKSISFSISGNWITNAPLAFSNYTGGYLSIYPGSRPVAAYDYATGDTLASASYDFAATKYYSVFAVGENGNFQNVIVNDNFDSLSSSNGQAYVRYINAIAGSTSPNVKVTAGGTDVINTTAPFASVSEFTAVAPGSIDISVNEGSAVSANRTITVDAKKVYTILLISGNTASDPAQIKFISNGTLSDEVGERTTSSAQIVNIQ